MEHVFEFEQRALRENVELLDDSSLANLRRYKYSSVDLSPTSKYILNPFWTWVAEFMPPWLAPNMITLIGISAIVSNLLLVQIYISDFESQAPMWVYFWFAFSLLFYQTMDNVDGKQARKTGTSSPLGELFDHGIDSLNCCWAGVVTSASMGLGLTWYSAVNAMATCVAMYFSTWETYYTHTLFLGFLNGPTEGLLVVVAIHIVTGIYGPQIWNNEIFGVGLKPLYGVIVILSVTVAHVPACLGNVKAALAERKELDKLPMAFRTTMPIVAMVVSVALWLSSPVSSVLDNNHLFLYTMAVSFTFARVTTSIILSHLCFQSFPVRSFSVMWVYLGGFVYGILGRLGINMNYFVPEYAYLWLWFIFAFGYFMCYANMVIDKLCSYLGIRAYTIGPRLTT